jgi:hypothetical protein
MTGLVVVSAAVEGIVDEAVVRKLIVHAGARPGTIYGKNGKAFLRKQINGYNNAARYSPWLVLVDLDRDAECAPPLRGEWIPDPAQHLCFRVAVREIEAWLMADAETLALFLSVARSRLAGDPEQILEPKIEMVNLARHSRRREIREDMVPRERSGRQVGPAYASRLMEYVETRWRPEVAAQGAESLSRAIDCLRRLIQEPA